MSDIKLPKLLEASDYHEFVAIDTALNGTGIRCKEIGFNGKYLGIIYTGTFQDPENRKMIDEIRKMEMA
ncbi:MAG: hypothetical protein WC119_00860 [Synergistaceae bacterium]